MKGTSVFHPEAAFFFFFFLKKRALVLSCILRNKGLRTFGPLPFPAQEIRTERTLLQEGEFLRCCCSLISLIQIKDANL